MADLVSSLLVWSNGELVRASAVTNENSPVTSPSGCLRSTFECDDTTLAKDEQSKSLVWSNGNGSREQSTNDARFAYQITSNKGDNISYFFSSDNEERKVNSDFGPQLVDIDGSSYARQLKLCRAQTRHSAASLQAQRDDESHQEDVNSDPTQTTMQSTQTRMEAAVAIPDLSPPVLMSLEDWESQNPYNSPAGLSHPKAMPLKVDVAQRGFVSRVHMLVQERGLQMELRTEEVARASFTATLFIDGQELDRSDEQYASKQEAKEAICKRNILRVAGWASKKRKNGDPFAQCLAPPDGIDDENWMGLLDYYSSKHGLPRSTIQTQGDHPANGPWYCELYLPEGSTKPFGSGMGPFRSKKVAERVAARDAVRWLRTEGKLDPLMRFNHFTSQKASSGAPAPIDSAGTTSPSEGTVKTTPQPNQPSSDTVASYGLAVVHSLGLSTPTFHTNQLGGAFVDMWAEFGRTDARYEPKLAGEISRVNGVYGKKTAKIECWRGVIRVLEEIRKSRQPHASA